LAGVLNSNPADVAVLVDVQKGVLVQVLSLADIGYPKFDIKCVGILEILNLHGLKDRSKKTFTWNPGQGVTATEIEARPG
jgi:hypothetical protein